MDSPIPEGFGIPDLMDLVDRLEVDKEGEPGAQRKVTRAIKFLCHSEEALRAVTDELHRRSLASQQFGRRAARALGQVAQLEVVGVKLRDIILRCIQTDFKRKEAILAQDETTFLNSVSLLCEVFEHLRLADGTVINVLAVRNQFLADSFSCKQKWRLCVL